MKITFHNTIQNFGLPEKKVFISVVINCLNIDLPDNAKLSYTYKYVHIATNIIEHQLYHSVLDE